MTPAEFSLLFVLGLVSSVHCLGMCGPVVLSYSLPMRGTRLAGHAAYHAGRIATYMLLGAAAGAAGQGIDLLARLAGLASGVRILGGAAMMVAGVLMLGTRAPNALVRIQRRGLTQRFSRAIGALILGSRPRHKLALGLTLGFLPCGLVYAVLLKALESGSAAAGALTMLAFGLGTALSLASIGLVFSVAGARLGNWTNRLAACAMLLFGTILVWRGLLQRAVCHG